MNTLIKKKTGLIVAVPALALIGGGSVYYLTSSSGVGGGTKGYKLTVWADYSTVAAVEGDKGMSISELAGVAAKLYRTSRSKA